ncbi:MAG TPA: 2-C-methyl-D-erythritol 4-phosphate cytidylyltransferase [Thermomicrobiaceae bacterium]|nr:2-C-methyl-D-erythritol 4-phosphate cytidylyltransferase [Thermomicrobiaceae bacterium]
MSGCGAVVVAAGSSRRMGPRDKTVEPLGGRAVIDWVLDALLAVPEIAELVVVTGPANAATVAAALDRRDVRGRVATCRGGPTRAESVRLGLAALSDDLHLVLIHDAARPLVTPDLCLAGIHAAEARGAAVAALPASDTIKRVDSSGLVLETLPRAELVVAQTPQVFRRDWLEAAYRGAGDAFRLVTDESALLERAGFPVEVYPGSPENLKLTTPSDLAIAEALLARRLTAPRS